MHGEQILTKYCLQQSKFLNEVLRYKDGLLCDVLNIELYQTFEALVRAGICTAPKG